MEELMRLSGIEEAKTAIMNEYFRVCVSKDQGKSPGLCFNARFDGNPGCGKTTVARIYAKLLKECGVVPESAIFIETSGEL
jgi:Holliday junction resolvasome RuvABC ATP-dependent DNA helicase subunit